MVLGLFLDLATIGLIWWNAWEYDKKLHNDDNSAPELATWLLFAVGTGLSLATYFRFAETISPFASALNFADVVGTSFISIVVANYNRRHPRRRCRGSIEDQSERADTLGRWIRWIRIACFVAAGVVACYWFKTSMHRQAYLAVQFIITVAWAPTLARVIGEKRSTEPIRAWVLNGLASALALVKAFFRRDIFTALYAGRSFIMISILLTLMAFYDRRAKK